MEKMSSMKRVLVNAKNKDKIPILSVIRADPESVAVATKLTDNPNRQRRFDAEGNLKIDTPSIQALREGAGVIVSRKEEAKNLMKMLPDLELIKQILTSSILAPKDLVNTELSYDFDDGIFGAQLKSLVKSKIETYFESTYKIKPILSDILEDVLFYTGSYPLVVLPENALDDLINGRSNYSFEVIQEEFLPNGNMRPVGRLGNPENPTRGFEKPTASFESLLRYKEQDHQRNYEPRVLFNLGNDVVDSSVRVTDNVNVLKRPMIEAALTKRLEDDISGQVQNELSLEALEEKAQALYGDLSASTEAIVDQTSIQLTDREVSDLLYKGRHSRASAIRVVKTQDQLKRRSVSESLIQHWPSESIIPTYVPGNEAEHVGYFLITDENGNPVTEKTLHQSPSDIFQANQNKPFSRNLTEYVSRGIQGSSFNCQNPLHMKQMVSTYQDVVEADLLARLRNGIYSSSAKIASNQEIFRIMLSRSLAGDMTQVLWVPKELLTYVAFEYDEDGVGVSLLHKSSVIGALRSALLFADVRLGIKNAVGQTVVSLTLDEDDPDPFKRINQAMGAFMRTRQESVPWNVRSPASTAEYIGKAGYIFRFDGHPGIPNMTIDQSESNSSYTLPDSELQERLAKQHSMSFGLPHEIVDRFSEPELATTVVNNSILLTKRVVQYQEKLNPHVTDHAQKVLKHSEGFIGEVKALIANNFEDIILSDSLVKLANEDKSVKENIIDITLRDVISTLTIELPKPDTATISNQLEDLNRYEEMLDKKLEAYVTSELVNPEVFGELAGNVDQIREILKAYYMRREMDRMGMGDELNQLFNVTDEEVSYMQDNVYQEYKDITNLLLTGFAKFVKEEEEFRSASDHVNESLGLEEGGGDSYDDDDSDYGSGDDSGDEDFDFESDLDSEEPTGSEETVDTETTEVVETVEGEDLGEDEPLSF